MKRLIGALSIGLLLSGCDSIYDAWVRRNFSADQAISGFSGRALIEITPFHLPSETTRRPFHDATRAAMTAACPEATGQAQQGTDRRFRMLVGPVAAQAVLALGDMILVEINQQLNDASDRLIADLSASSAAALTVARLHPGSGSACFVVARWGARPDDETGPLQRLWEFGFVVWGVNGAHDAVVIQPRSLVFERSAASTRDGGPVDLDIAVTLHAPGQDNTMTPRGTTEFRLRRQRPGTAPTPVATDGTPQPNAGRAGPPQMITALRPQIGTAFVGPGDRFSVIGVAVTESGSGADEVRRERAFRDRHQQAVRDLFHAIAGDRLGVAPLPGR